MTDAIEIDADSAKAFREAAGAIAQAALNGISDKLRLLVAAHVNQGAELYLHVQMIPQFMVLLVLNQADPDKPPVELARWIGDSPEALKRSLH